MSDRTSLALIQAGNPTTFAERGVAVPFTTPALAGARVRRAPRGGSELIVPNPAGRRGEYVVQWDSLAALCRPTVHDTRLAARLRILARPDPDSVRSCAWDVAADGFAGPAASRAAEAARETDRDAERQAGAALLLRVVEQSARAGSPLLAELRQADARCRAQGAGLVPGDGLARAVGDLAARLAPLGLGRAAEAARLPRLLLRLSRLRDEAARLALAETGESAALMHDIAAATAEAIGCAVPVLTALRALPDDMPALIRRWCDAPETLAAELARPAWLLDGWESVVLLWASRAAGGDPRETLAAMAALLPLLPDEAAAWLGGPAGQDAARRVRARPPPATPARGGGSTFERIARAEEMRAMAA